MFTPGVITDAELEVLLLEAQQAPLGVAVRTNDPFRLRARLYPLIKKTGVEFKITIPITPEELWLVKKEA